MTELISIEEAEKDPPYGKVLIVGVDPGITTGVAFLWFDEDHIDVSKATLFSGFQVSTGGSGQLEDFIGSGPLATASLCAKIGSAIKKFAAHSLQTYISIENFELRNRTMDKDLLSPVLVIGGLVQTLAEDIEENEWKLTFQTASQAKTTCTNERMKKWLDLNVEKRSIRHLLDAARHAALTCRSLMASPLQGQKSISKQQTCAT